MTIRRVAGVEHGLDCRRVEPECLRRLAFETLDLRAKKTGGAEQQFIGGMLDQHFVAGRDQRGHREEIGHRRAVGGDDLLHRHAVAVSDPLPQRSITGMARAIEIEIGDADTEPVQMHMRHFAPWSVNNAQAA